MKIVKNMFMQKRKLRGTVAKQEKNIVKIEREIGKENLVINGVNDREDEDRAGIGFKYRKRSKLQE